MIYVMLADGFEEIEALTAVDLLRRAGKEVMTVGVTGKTVLGSHRIPVVADLSPEEAERYPYAEDMEMVVLPGGMPGATHLDGSSLVENYLRSAQEKKVYLAAICAAPMVLGKRGLLKGYKACCYPGFENDLIGATVVNAGCVSDGLRITGRSMGSATEFALALVSALCGAEISEKIAQSIIFR